MMLQFHLYTVVLFISALATLVTAIIILRRNVPRSLALAAVLLSTFVWSGAYAISWLPMGPTEKIFWIKMAFLGAAFIPITFLVFTLRITHTDKWLTTRNLILLSIEPVVMIVWIWFRTDLIFPRLDVEIREGIAILHLVRGAGYWIHVIYSYAMILVGLVVLHVSSTPAHTFFRRQYLIILFASLLALAANIFTQATFRALAGLDLSPIAFAISSILYAYAVFRFQFMELLPVARGRLIESMSDGVLVLDAKGRIVDINPAMKSFLDEEPVALIGQNFSQVLAPWQNNADQLLDSFETRTEIKLQGKPSRYLDLRITPLYNDHQELSGRLIVFRDVTDRKEVEKDLRRAMDRLQTQLIEIGTLQSQLREQAIRDALTNVFNRRYLEETLERELARAEREAYPLCVIMMDLDYFKDVNDTYGHEAGDVVLKTLAETVTRQSRHGDFVCRYGGEEFVLVMPNIGLATARQRAEELHQVINSLDILYGVFTLTTTISMGVAIYPEHGKTKEELLRAADRAMYIAKNTGRNRVVVYPEPEMTTD